MNHTPMQLAHTLKWTQKSESQVPLRIRPMSALKLFVLLSAAWHAYAAVCPRQPHPSTCYGSITKNLEELAGDALTKFHKDGLMYIVRKFEEISLDLVQADTSETHCLESLDTEQYKKQQDFKVLEARLKGACSQDSFPRYTKNDRTPVVTAMQERGEHASRQEKPFSHMIQLKDKDDFRASLTKKRQGEHMSLLEQNAPGFMRGHYSRELGAQKLRLQTSGSKRNDFNKKALPSVYVPSGVGQPSTDRPSRDNTFLHVKRSCRLSTFKKVANILNIIFFRGDLEHIKPRFVKLLQEHTIPLPKVDGVSFGQAKFKHVNFDSMELEDKESHLTFSIKGLEVETTMIDIGINTGFWSNVFSFLQTTETGFFKKVGAVIKSAFKDEIKCKGTAYGSLGKTDLTVDIVFDMDGKKFAFKNTQFSLEKLNVGFTLDGVCAVCGASCKADVTRQIKSELQSVMNTEIAKAEEDISEELLKHPAAHAVLDFCDETNGLFDECSMSNLDHLLRLFRDARKFFQYINDRGWPGSIRRHELQGELREVLQEYEKLARFYRDEAQPSKYTKVQPGEYSIIPRWKRVESQEPEFEDNIEPLDYKPDNTLQNGYLATLAETIASGLKTFLSPAEGAEEIMFNLCGFKDGSTDLDIIQHAVEKAPSPVRKLATDAVSGIFTYLMCKRKFYTCTGYGKPFFFYVRKTTSTLARMERDAKVAYANPYQDAVGSAEKELNMMHLKKRFGDAFINYGKRVAYKLLDEGNGVEATTKRYDAFLAVAGDQVVRRTFDRIFQFCRDVRQFLQNGEDLEMREGTKESDTRFKRDLKFAVTQLNKWKCSGRDTMQCTRLKLLLPALVKTIYSLKPYDLYFNVWNPSLLGAIVTDSVVGNNLHMGTFIKTLFDALSAAGNLELDHGRVQLGSTFDFVQDSVLKPIFDYKDGDTCTKCLSETHPGGAWAHQKAREAKCAENKEQTCYFVSEPCSDNIEEAVQENHLLLQPTYSQCTPCEIGASRCYADRSLTTELIKPYPKRPWNVKHKITTESLEDQLLDAFTFKPQNLHVEYQACALKESVEQIRAVESQCPGVMLPEPNMLRLFQKRERVEWTYLWDSLRVSGSSKEQNDAIENFKSKTQAKNTELGMWRTEGNTVEGFKCNDDCQRCYGNDGYTFPTADDTVPLKGYDITSIPTTTTYNNDANADAIPWIRKENWNVAEGKYRPRCECEPSYDIPPGSEKYKKCKGTKFKDITMVCELVRNGGILSGCHEGHFVMSVNKGTADTRCLMIQIKFKEPEHCLGLKSNSTKQVDITRRCAKERTTFSARRPSLASRAEPTFTFLEYGKCPAGFHKEVSGLGKSYCRKFESGDSFVESFKAWKDRKGSETDSQCDKSENPFYDRRRRLLQHSGATS